MPPTPKYLHKLGAVDLTEPNTWKVRIANESGQEIARLSSEDFKSVFAQDEELAKHTRHKNGVVVENIPLNRLNWKDIKLDGSVIPSKPLSEQDALLVLKAYLGI